MNGCEGKYSVFRVYNEVCMGIVQYGVRYAGILLVSGCIGEWR